MLSSDFRRTLAMTIDVLRVARDPWWIISSAAVALHGATGVDPADVDVLTSANDARGVLDDMAVATEIRAPSDMFCSAVFGRWTVPPLAVEIMADLHVFTVAGWMPIRPRTRVPIVIENRFAYVPDRRELAAMLRSFGRSKDLARADLLDAQR